MTYSMMTNMKHLMPADPVADMPAQAQQLKKFLGAIVMAATSSLDPALLSALPCRKRINRASCSGLLETKPKAAFVEPLDTMPRCGSRLCGRQ